MIKSEVPLCSQGVRSMDGPYQGRATLERIGKERGLHMNTNWQSSTFHTYNTSSGVLSADTYTIAIIRAVAIKRSVSVDSKLRELAPISRVHQCTCVRRLNLLLRTLWRMTNILCKISSTTAFLTRVPARQLPR